MQIAYISNRPDIALGTLDFVEALMPWISHGVIVCPRSQLVHLERPRRRLTITLLPEEELLDDLHARFEQTRDHQVKNWLLRSSLARHRAIDDEFLMSDDDSRPLRPITEAFFREDRRHHRFHTYDLAAWQAQATDYDAGQHQTRALLEERGYPTLSYSAHMPQIIDKALYAEVVDAFEDATRQGLAIDEWSLYFNVAPRLRPHRFQEPRLYETLCWPALPTDWDIGDHPDRLSFENYTPTLYTPGGLFEDIPRGHDPDSQHEHSDEKVKRRQAVQRVYDSLIASGLRRAARLLQRLASSGRPRRLLPEPARRLLRDAELHGDDPAWSFPSFMTRYRCRYGNP